MGQSSSRSQRSAPQNATTSSTSSPQAAAADPSANSSQPGPSEPSTSSHSRSSLRKKVVSMIRPGSHREREDVGGERASRRLSKSPAQPQVLEDAQQSEASSSHRPPSPALSHDKGKNRADVEELPEEPHVDTPPPPIARAPSPPPAPPAPPAPAPVLSAPVPAPAPAPALPGLRDESDARDILSRWRSEVPDSSDEEDNVPSRANLNRNPLSPAPPQTTATPRQFPPPGTLVVVQGIVHTADVSRPPPDRPTAGTEARGGAFTRSSPPSSFGRSSTDSSTTGASESLPSSDTGSRSSGISPGSVDVLGTLLSVAAAATAASLLTGSSEPILSSGLAPPGSTNPGSPIAGDQAAQQQDATFAASRAERMRQAWGTIRERLGLRPTPSPRTSLGLGPNGLGAGNSLGGLGAGPGVTDTREIMLEEMARAFNIGLGLNGFGAAPSSPGSTSTTTSPDGDVRARGTVPVDDEISDEGAGSGVLPPEGSFDRFLVDLQSDLRVALTGEETEEGSTERQRPEQEATEAPIASTSTQSASASQPPPPLTTPPPLPTPTALSMDVDPVTALALDGEHPADDVDDDMPALESITDSESDTRENETTDDGEDDAPMSDEERQRFMDTLAREIGIGLQPLGEQVDGDATPRATGPSPSPDQTATGQPTSETTPATNGTPASGPMSSTGSRNGRMDESGRINWWRLYRFPAINSAAPSPSTSPSASPSATTPISTSESSTPPTSTDDASSSSGSQHPTSSPQPPGSFPIANSTTPAPTTTPFLPNFLPPPAGQTVVPVIVVGLQSVAAGQFGFEAVPATQNHTHTHGHLHNHLHNHTHNTARTPPPMPSFAAPGTGHARTRQEELAVLEDMLREAEAEAEADALLYDSLERLTRGGSGAAGAQDRRDPWERLGSQMRETQNRSRGQRVTVEEVEDEDAGGPSRPRPQPRRDVDELIAEDEALDLDDADDEEEDSEDEKEEVEESEDEEQGDEEARDDYYRRSDRNARARALAKAEAKKEAKRAAKEEKKKKQERREKARQARAARLAAAADARARAAANASTSAGASGSGAGGGLGTSPVRGASSPVGSGGERATGSTAWSRYAEQLRDLHNQMREERPGPALRSPVSPFGAGAASPLRPPVPGAGAGGLGVGMTMGGMGGAAGAGMGMGMGLPAGPGSRTFLIYVIGGYYPPDHTIVTGGPESFQSFEALLELAEMLGHAKPPTVTKEEIDKSGLETIKPAQLAEYEEAGKISSNCTERCLICLDDYEPEDDVRVMSCRHAFHQGCVDTWLQTGRNNCPACRSTGVNAEANSTTA